ncbi:hypothetical protein BIW11_05602 [Tropilaelaps mercedesae]|uniref:Uncharacterized protein n=1 Tax=Tropilaelaps mercedesae TaxID=418985 RepID=A0A1V9Y1K6_9ACAR|nr:hypothetical protein BIW11_05602 [Tropilaelaps mercedesae]
MWYHQHSLTLTFMITILDMMCSTAQDIRVPLLNKYEIVIGHSLSPVKGLSLGMVKGRSRQANSCSHKNSIKGATDHDAAEREGLMRPTDRTPLVLGGHEEWISSEVNQSYDSPTVMSSLFLASLCFTLSGALLLFFSENILSVLWPSIGLVIIGSSLTVITVMPGAGRWMIQQIRLIRTSTKACWRNKLCGECVRDLGRSNANTIRIESNEESR